MSRNAMSRASSFSRSRATLRFPRLSSSNGGLSDTGEPMSEAKRPRNGSPPGGSSLITLAPQSPSIAAADGPATQRPSSTTLTPSSGPGMACLTARLLHEKEIPDAQRRRNPEKYGGPAVTEQGACLQRFIPPHNAHR